MVLNLLYDFFHRIFWTPGYDVVDTLTYGIVLGFCVFGIIPLLRRLNVRFDRRFVAALTPYVFFGGTMRELVDRGLGVYPGYAAYPGNFWLVAPGIYLTMFAVTLLALAASILFFRGRYHAPMLLLGLALCFYNLSLIIPNIKNPRMGGLVLFFLAASAAATFLVARYKLPFLLADGNHIVVLAHLTDASATFVGVDFMGFVEKHVLPNFLIGILGTAAVMYPLKLVFVVAALYYIDKEYPKDELTRHFIKFVIAVLGMGPGLRDITLILMA